MLSATDKRLQFRQLHQQSPLVLVNPWDLGGAERLQSLGAKALATTSAGFAWSKGKQDFEVGLNAALAHLTELCAGTELPVNADFESGFAIEPEALAQNVKAALATGVAGLSIEDRDGDGLFDLSLSVARIKAAKAAMLEVAPEAMLVGRCEGLLTATASLEEVAERLAAYADAGADVLYAPGLTAPDDAKVLVEAVAPKPLNVLLLTPQMTVSDFSNAGVQRFSTGFGLSLAAWQGFENAAKSVLQQGHFPN